MRLFFFISLLYLPIFLLYKFFELIFHTCLFLPLTVKNKIYHIAFSISVFSFPLKKTKVRSNLHNRTDCRFFRFLPVQIRFSGFKSGSHAKRFCMLLGSDAGPVHGRIDRSGPVLITLMNN
jgi:hypothetical protein